MTAPPPDSELAADIVGFDIPDTEHNRAALRELIAFGLRAGAL